jgi:CBS domain-containing protein
MRIAELCTRAVVTCRRDATAQTLARVMRDRHVGDVIVIDEREVPIGIVTDRDLVVQVMAAGVAPEALRAEDLIGGGLTTALTSETVYDAIWAMRSKGIRRLPVVDEQEHLVGVLTSDDITEFLAQELTGIARVMPRQLEIERVSRR